MVHLLQETEHLLRMLELQERKEERVRSHLQFLHLLYVDPGYFLFGKFGHENV